MKIAKILVVLILVSSCIPQRKLQYVQTDNDSPETYKLKVPTERKIAPGDYLSIRVESPDERNFFATTGSGVAGGSNSDEISMTQSAYLVDTLGEINLPVIGKVNVNGLTLNESSEKLQKIVKSYLSDPTVDVRYAFKSFTILGEVNNPGRYYFATADFSIFQAIGEAGDLMFYGRRQDVSIIREENYQTRKIRIDLRDENIMLSDNYFIRDKDIILVNTRNYIRWEQITNPITTLASSLTLYVLVVNIF